LETVVRQHASGQPTFAFIAYYNRTMAKPFKWTDQGESLAA